MPSAYIASLNRDLEQTAAVSSMPKMDLRQRFTDWFASLPEISRHRAFAMTELEGALATQGKYLSSILLRLGWRRSRRWTSAGQYNRYWMPPREQYRRSE